MARRSGLGKGLSALIPAEVAADKGTTFREVPISSIRPNPQQPRSHFDEAAMSSLAASIGELGVLQPVLVRQVADGPESYELIAGERRWRAARRAGLQTIPVIVQESATDRDSLEQALVENLHREDLNPLEEASAYQQLIDEFDYTHEQVAVRVGKSRTAVTNTLRLLQLPAGAQRALAEGTITAGHARALLGTPDRALQESLVVLTVREGLTVRALEDRVRRAAQGSEEGEEEPEEGPAPVPIGTTSGRKAQVGGQEGSERAAARPRRLPEPGVLELEELLSSHLNTSVRVELHHRRGRLVVDFATLDDLERIYRLMVEGPSGDHLPGSLPISG